MWAFSIVFFQIVCFLINILCLKNFNKLKKKIDYTVITTPNYLHFKYIEFALSNGSNVICEKPLVISLSHLNKIEELEKNIKKKFIR